MKFSKLMKNGNSKQEMKLRRNAVLLSGLYGDIGTKSPIVNNYFTPKKSDDLDNTLIPSTPLTAFKTSPLAKLFEFKSVGKQGAIGNALAKQRLVDCLMETPRLSAMTPKANKSVSKSKRLQRKEYVRSKPEAYVLRSSVVGLKTPVSSNKQGNLFIKNESVSKTLFSSKTTPENVATPSNSGKKQESAMKKLKKFVSKSALKVINHSSGSGRKSLGSQCSSSSSIGMDSVSSDDDSFSNLSMEQKRININLEKLIDEEKQPKTSWQFQPAYKVPKSNGIANRSARPCMGISSVMLKNLKAQNPHVSYTACMPSQFLVSVPHCFNETRIYGNEVKPVPVETTVKAVVPEQAYDHLTRVNYNAIKQKSKFHKNKSCSNTGRLFASNSGPNTSPKVTNISVFSKQKHLSAVNLNESQQYDSIIF